MSLLFSASALLSEQHRTAQSFPCHLSFDHQGRETAGSAPRGCLARQGVPRIRWGKTGQVPDSSVCVSRNVKSRTPAASTARSLLLRHELSLILEQCLSKFCSFIGFTSWQSTLGDGERVTCGCWGHPKGQCALLAPSDRRGVGERQKPRVVDHSVNLHLLQ